MEREAADKDGWAVGAFEVYGGQDESARSAALRIHGWAVLA